MDLANYATDASDRLQKRIILRALSFSTRTAACAFELILGIGWVAETGRLGELTTYRNRLSIV
jgi:hypothetical protein